MKTYEKKCRNFHRKRRCLPVILLLFLVSFLVSASPARFVRAYPFPPQQDEAEFLRWYAENKNADHAVYTLKGDLVLSSGTADAPVVLDGSGNVTIDCGEYVIVACSNVILDNPALTITGNSYCTILATTGVLSLQQGTVHLETGSGRAVSVSGGTDLSLITPSADRRFTITAKGDSVSGLYYAGPDHPTLSNLDIRTDGVQKSIGIEFFHISAAAERCTIDVTGQFEVYGLYNYRSLELAESRIKAHGTGGNALCYCAFSPLEEASFTWDADSLLEPLPQDTAAPGKIYTILKQVFEEPCTIPTGTYAQTDFPSEALFLVRDDSSGESTERKLPVQWDFSALNTSSQGASYLPGSLDTSSLEGIYRSEAGLTPQLCVICVEDNQIFIQNWGVYESAADWMRLLIMLPYPFGADRLLVQYSTDGVHYTDYEEWGENNLLELSSRLEPPALYPFLLNFPFYSPTLYVRAVISGDTLYAGVSPVWKLDITSGGGELPIPDYGGDRGGQTVEQETGTSNPETSNPEPESTPLDSNAVITYETQQNRDPSFAPEEQEDIPVSSRPYEPQNKEPQNKEPQSKEPQTYETQASERASEEEYFSASSSPVSGSDSPSNTGRQSGAADTAETKDHSSLWLLLPILPALSLLSGAIFYRNRHKHTRQERKP